MIESEYREIASACDRLLRAPDTSLARLAIPLLHLVDEHPSHLAQYASLTGTAAQPAPSAIGNALRTARAFCGALLRSLRSMRFLSDYLQATGRVDVLIVSWTAAGYTGPGDFYFGDMQRLLSDGGAATALVVANRLPVTPWDEMRIWLLAAIARRRLRRQAKSMQQSTGGAVAMLASQQALSGATVANLRLHAGISRICRLLDPRIVITTYEGAAAERMIWHATRQNGRQPLCVGYQHTRLLERAHAIRRAVRAPGLHCDPQVVLTLGEIPQATLAASPDLGPIKLIVYGSHRRARRAPSLAFASRPRRCLVLADASASECAILFKFAAACARLCPGMEFALRPHPVVSIEALSSQYEWLRDLPANVTFSTAKSLEADCAGARYCLYRGSSAAIHAVLAGVKPLYLSRAGELPPDPLFGLTGWRETVASPEQFSQSVQAEDAASSQAAAQHARSFCDRFVSVVRPEALDELLALAR